MTTHKIVGQHFHCYYTVPSHHGQSPINSNPKTPYGISGGWGAGAPEPEPAGAPEPEPAGPLEPEPGGAPGPEPAGAAEPEPAAFRV